MPVSGLVPRGIDGSRIRIGAAANSAVVAPDHHKSAFLDDVHALRAVAIVFIVAGHCIPLFNWNHPHSHVGWFSSLMPNGTVFFVFIAGLLFQHLSARFDFATYLAKKWRHVILPYLVLSLPIMLTQAVTHQGVFSPSYTHHWTNFAGNALLSILTGVHILGPFWFIPMISILYLLAPLLIWLDRNPSPARVAPLLLPITVLVHRPENFDHVWHSLAYFLPVYLYGMWFSRNRERAIAWHERWLAPLVVLIAGLLWLEVMVLHRPGYITSATMFSTENGIIDTNAIQKLLLCGVLLVALRRWSSAISGLLRHLGDVSFGIFFLHMLFINAYAMAIRNRPVSTLPLYGLAVVLTIALCCVHLWGARRAFGRYSRSVIGC